MQGTKHKSLEWIQQIEADGKNTVSFCRRMFSSLSHSRQDGGKNMVSFSRRMLKSTLWNIMLITGTVVYGSYSVLVHLCEVDGKIPFSSSSAVFMIELFKLTFCAALYTSEVVREGFHWPTLSFSIPFAVPAVLYCINNNIAVHMQLHMDPTTYQVLSNMKIATTAVLYRLIIKRHLSKVEWLSVFLLTVAGIFDSYGGYEAKGLNTASNVHITVTGLVLMSTYCVISGFSGVYTEYILKQHYKISLFLQNILLYIFGLLVNGSIWIIQELKSSNTDESFNLFRGYSVYTWIIIITQASNGLIMSAVMKHANNITRLFIISSSMIVTTVLSLAVFQTELNFYFICSLIVVLIALYLYHQK